MGSVIHRSVRIVRGAVTVTRPDLPTSCRCGAIISLPSIQWKTWRNWGIRRSRWHDFIYPRSAIVTRNVRSANSNSMLTGTKGTEWVFEYHSRNITFAFALGLDAVLAGRALLAALDPSFSTRCTMSTVEDLKRNGGQDLLRHPVLVRFRAFSAAALAGSVVDGWVSDELGSLSPLACSGGSLAFPGSCPCCAGPPASGIVSWILSLRRSAKASLLSAPL